MNNGRKGERGRVGECRGEQDRRTGEDVRVIVIMTVRESFVTKLSYRACAVVSSFWLQYVR